MKPLAIVAGHLCLDITPQFTHGVLPAPGQLAIVGPATFSPGGAVSNTGQDMLRLGIETYLCGKVGDDLFGRAVVDILEQRFHGSGQGIVVAIGETTSYTIVLAPPGKDRAFLHCPGANDTFVGNDVPDEVLSQADLLHFGYPPLLRRMYADNGHELVGLYRRAKAAGLTTALDLCMLDPSSESGWADWTRILTAVLPYVDIFVPSADELLLMQDRNRYQQMAQAGAVADQIGATEMNALANWALDRGTKVVMLKASTRGIYLRTGDLMAISSLGRAVPPKPQAWANRELWAAPFKAYRVVTTTGAGDAAVAGFLTGLLRGYPPEQALNLACAAGACACEAADATSGVLPWEELQQRLAVGWQRLWSDAPATGWVWDQVCDVWRGPQDGSGKRG